MTSPVPDDKSTSSRDLCTRIACSLDRIVSYRRMQGPLVLVGNEAEYLAKLCKRVSQRLFAGEVAGEDLTELRAGVAAEEADGVKLIAAERGRQVLREGFTQEHDDEHNNDELARAAACYAIAPLGPIGNPALRFLWPWQLIWWRPSPEDRVRELVKAGALIAAEIDRLQRAKRKAAA